jgi:tripartite ATP-independent transporter DctP family solute receptor
MHASLRLPALLGAGAIVAYLATGAVASAQEQLRGWNIHTPGYPVSEGMEEFARLVEERTDGRYQLQVFHSGELGDQPAAIEQLQFGAIDFAVFNLVPLNPVVPETMVPCLPFIFTSSEQMYEVMDGEIGDEIAEAMAEQGIHGLAWYASGARSFYTRDTPIHGPGDIQGRAIRVQSSDLFLRMIEVMGGNPSVIAFGELYTAIQTGVVDGAENNWPSYEDTGHYEVAPYYTVNEHTIVPETLAVSADLWNRLSEEDREIFREAARESALLQRDLWHEREAESRRIVEEAGVTIIEGDEVDKQGFQDAMAPVYDEFASEPHMAELVRRIQEFGTQ